MTETLTATDNETTADDIDSCSDSTAAVMEEVAMDADVAPRVAAAPDGGAAKPAKPVAVPVSRAIGGPKRRRSADQRWEVTQADLNMYGLIVGRVPSEAERVAALSPVPNEATALRDAGAGRGGSGAFMRWRDRAHHGDAPTWSPSVMFSYLREVYHFGAHLTGPHVSAWVRHVSTEARRRLQETQARLAPPRVR